MDVYYLCQTGKYAALLAAAFHLQILQANVSYKNYSSYIQDKKISLFEPYFLGEDQGGRRIYVVATNTEQKLVATIIKSFITTFTKHKNTLVIDSLPKPNLFLLVILKLSKVFWLKSIFQKMIPFAVWLDRHKIYASYLHTWQKVTKA